MQRQRELLQPFAQISEKALGIGLVLKANSCLVISPQRLASPQIEEDPF